MACRYRRCLSPRGACLARGGRRRHSPFCTCFAASVWRLGVGPAWAWFCACSTGRAAVVGCRCARSGTSDSSTSLELWISGRVRALRQPAGLRANRHERGEDEIGETDDHQAAHHAEGAPSDAVERPDGRVLHAFGEAVADEGQRNEHDQEDARHSRPASPASGARSWPRRSRATHGSEIERGECRRRPGEDRQRLATRNRARSHRPPRPGRRRTTSKIDE